jgi:hypothetical protein
MAGDAFSGVSQRFSALLKCRKRLKALSGVRESD